MLGGQQLWLKGESGTSYYYAHLSAYAPDLKVGQLVDAGTLVGLVGHTGDAYGPHLHFEVHPGGGPAIDPYPILVAADPDHQHSV
ncbi:M23 family metallopeptidase, partial [Pantoea sp. GbtcB22]|uniref:M23 family metallopeptidase n=1 Tax=Pantoea sp. GbtcB22 TaxID=2824767 RepID=UPI001C300898